ncbi:hypothetical protein V475_12105 [Sphingobium baderi LL03]|uniref:Uncharacterized protein n=1 Tax=Sphingobium baderi LL03 TaxID=1114964 RepID=T0HGB7_9SPHN|nr:hypothetical protein L485_23935 [Sphingobium baderi LL03]KMS64416.1 hypothetical protein V475_12105 [Sphingobium baderi LL03]
MLMEQVMCVSAHQVRGRAPVFMRTHGLCIIAGENIEQVSNGRQFLTGASRQVCLLPAARL